MCGNRNRNCIENNFRIKFSGLLNGGKLRRLFIFILSLPRLPFIWLISIYQKTFSPDHGVFKSLFPHGYCKFTPSCSEYGRLALKKYGVLRGLPMMIWRVIRCNPWSNGGEDWP